MPEIPYIIYIIVKKKELLRPSSLQSVKNIVHHGTNTRKENKKNFNARLDGHHSDIATGSSPKPLPPVMCAEVRTVEIRRLSHGNWYRSLQEYRHVVSDSTFCSHYPNNDVCHKKIPVKMPLRKPYFLVLLTSQHSLKELYPLVKVAHICCTTSITSGIRVV